MRRQTALGFFAGVIFCATAIGATTWLRAGNDDVITACANKKTGAMRFSKSGSCNRKTENVVSWNASGVAGPAGPIGATGPKGETGPPGSTLQTSDVMYVFDVGGKKLGRLLDLQLGDNWDHFTIGVDDRYFQVNSLGQVSGMIYFSEPNCVGTPFEFFYDDDLTANYDLPKSRLIPVIALNERRPRFFARQDSRAARPGPRVRSILTDQYPAGGEDPTNIDGIGSCTNIEFSVLRPARILTEVPAPVEWDMSGPLRIGTDK